VKFWWLIDWLIDGRGGLGGLAGFCVWYGRAKEGSTLKEEKEEERTRGAHF